MQAYRRAFYSLKYQAEYHKNALYSDLSLAYNVNTFAIVLGILFISEAIFLLVIPLVNKRRATLGILFAGGRVISKKYVDKARWYQILGKFAFIFLFDTALFYFALGEVILILMPFIIMLTRLFNKDRRSLQDLIVGIKVIDNKTFVPLVDRSEPTVVEATPKLEDELPSESPPKDDLKQ